MSDKSFRVNGPGADATSAQDPILHDVNLAAQYADRLLLLNNARRWYYGTPAEVLNPKSIYEVFESGVRGFYKSKNTKQLIMPKELPPIYWK